MSKLSEMSQYLTATTEEAEAVFELDGTYYNFDTTKMPVSTYYLAETATATNAVPIIDYNKVADTKTTTYYTFSQNSLGKGTNSRPVSLTSTYTNYLPASLTVKYRDTEYINQSNVGGSLYNAASTMGDVDADFVNNNSTLTLKKFSNSANTITQADVTNNAELTANAGQITADIVNNYQ